MKNRNVKSFLAGVLTTALIGCCSITALASTGVISLQVTPVKVLVNNQEFKPKDTKGNDALVFNYNGVVYAPLRPLAESYGLNVGWDQQNQMATVGESVEVPKTPNKPTIPQTPTTSYKTADMSTYEKFREIFECTNDIYNYPKQADNIKYYYELKSDYDDDDVIVSWMSISKEEQAKYLNALFNECFTGKEYTDQIDLLIVGVFFGEGTNDNKMKRNGSVFSRISKYSWEKEARIR